MYIDRIYTKLYSERDWDGLDQLISEIRSFTISEQNKAALNAKLRLARAGKLKSRGGDDTSHNNILNLVKNSEEGDSRAALNNRNRLNYMYDEDTLAKGNSIDTLPEGTQ